MLGVALGLLAISTPALASADDDADFDGLEDAWERTQKFSTKRATLVLVPVLRPGMTKTQVQPALDKVVAFFGKVPNKNIDGSTGIDVVIRWGNTLPASDASTPYQDVRSRGIPGALVGKGHGVLIVPSTSGGGQTNRADWSVVSNEWHTIVHELGHQLGLNHSPPNKPGSPFYTSIMNYDYNYQFNGDPEAVHFSTGKFRQLRLNEQRLPEPLNYSVADLEFLTKAPHRYELKKLGGAAMVDWNRNGIFGESDLRVDINGGYAVATRDRVDTTHIAGGFALATISSRLVSVFANNEQSNSLAYKDPGLTPESRGWLGYQVQGTSGPCPAARLAGAVDVTGDPHAVEAFGRLFVTIPTASGYDVAAYAAPTVPANGCMQFTRVGRARDTHAAGEQPILARTATGLVAFQWNPTTRRVQWRTVNATAGAVDVTLGPVRQLTKSDGTPLTSESPVGATFNAKTGRLVLAITERGARFNGWMKMVELGQHKGGWRVQSLRPLVSDVERDGNATLSRPTVLFDGRPTAGPTGQYLFFARAERVDPREAAVTTLVRFTPGAGEARDAWTKQKMISEWSKTVSPTSAVLFGDDIAWGQRIWTEKNDGFNNLLQLFLRASGVTDKDIGDFDDVKFIATQGLRRIRQ